MIRIKSKINNADINACLTAAYRCRTCLTADYLPDCLAV
jgi:hypothetical protein